MHHAIVFNYFEFGTQQSDMSVDMSQFHKIFNIKCSHRKFTETFLGFPGTHGLSNYAKSLVKRCQIASINVKIAENNLEV